MFNYSSMLLKSKFWHLTLLALVFTVSVALAKDEEGKFDGEVQCKTDQLFQNTYLPQIQKLEPDLKRILNYVLKDSNETGNTYDELGRFVDKFGSRLAGTENLERAIDYMLDKMKTDGHQNVRGEPVQIPKWTRGNEWVQMVSPLPKKLNILGLGSSEGTNGKTLEAEAIVVHDFDELERRSAEVSGKIVIYNYKYVSYGVSVTYRLNGATRAAKHGAVAALVRSVTGFSIDSPHTGNQEYKGNVTRIPAIAITVEDSEMFGRMAERGGITISGNLLCKLLYSTENLAGKIVPRL